MAENQRPEEQKPEPAKNNEPANPAGGQTGNDWAESDFFKVWLRLARESQNRPAG